MDNNVSKIRNNNQNKHRKIFDIKTQPSKLIITKTNKMNNITKTIFSIAVMEANVSAVRLIQITPDLGIFIDLVPVPYEDIC